MGGRQQSESIEVALDMEQGGLMNRFDIGRCNCKWSHNLSAGKDFVAIWIPVGLSSGLSSYDVTR